MADTSCSTASGKSKVKFSKSSSIINGIVTDVACYGFENKNFIILTQFKRPGSLMHIQLQDIGRNITDESTVEISVDFLLGIDDPVYRAYAKKIAMTIFKSSRKPILLAIALKDKSPANVRAISELLMENQVW